MALPPIYSARTRTSVVPLAPRRVASSGISEGLSVLGRAGAAAVERDRRVDEAELESAHRIALEEQKRERSRRAMAFGAQLAEARIDYAKRAEEARGQTEPGAPGWEATARELVAEVFSPLASTYADDEELAARLAPQLQQVTAGIVADEAAWEIRQRADWEGKQFESVLQAEADALLTNPSPDAMQAALERTYELIGLTDYDGNTKAELAKLARRTIVGGTFDGLAIAGQYDALDALLQSGKFDGLLGDDKDNYLRTVAAGRQAQAREAAIAESEAREAAREELDLIEVLIDNGEDVPQSRVAAAIKAGQAAGVPADELAEAAFLGERAVNARQFRAMGDAALQDEIAALGARESAGQLDPAGARRLAQAEKALGARDAAKGESLATLWKSGPEGRQQAVAQLAAMPADRAWSAAEKAGNPRMAIYARLSPQGQRLAIQGREAREARPDDFLPKRQGKPDKDAAEAAFREFIGPTLTMRLGGGFDDVLAAALDVMAGTGQAWDEGNFLRAVRVVYGATRRSDGTIQGGIGQVRGRMVELPGAMTAAEFDRALARADFAGARYRGGQAASKADVLANYTPVPVAERGGRTRYRFADARFDWLLDEQGHPFEAEF